MKITFTTNLDKYSSIHFPENLVHVPRISEKIYVKKEFEKYFLNKRLPTRLEVVDVFYYENKIICELWYNERDVNLRKESDLF